MPELKVEQKTIFECGSYDLDAFLSEVFDTDFEFEAAEELGDGDVRTYTVKPQEADLYTLGEWGKGNWVYDTGSMLNHACFLGYIKPGEYVINNRA